MLNLGGQENVNNGQCCLNVEPECIVYMLREKIKSLHTSPNTSPGGFTTLITCVLLHLLNISEYSQSNIF